MASIMPQQHHRAESIDGPFQTEMESTSDETLLSLKRKSISLNSSDLQVTMSGSSYIISELSREQRKDMRKRLKTELKQVQGIVEKLALLEQHVRSSEKEVSSQPPNSSSLPPPLEIPSRIIDRQGSFAGSDGNLGTPGTTTSKEKRTPKANQMYCNSDYINAKDKMPPPEKLKPKAGTPGSGASLGKKSGGGGGGGGGIKSEFDLKRQKVDVSRQRRMADMMKQCATALKKLMTHKHAWVFNEPVDVIRLRLHDYNKVIKRPMDLGTIKKKLEAGQYCGPLEFADDVKLTFSNAMTYNPPGHDVFVMADILRKQFEDRWKSIREKLEEEQIKCRAEDEILSQYNNNTAQTEQIEQLKQHLSNIEDQLSTLNKGKPTPPKKSSKRLMTFEEKKQLSENLMQVPPEKSPEIVRIIKKHHPNLCRDKDEIEVDIDLVDNDTLWELEKFVARCFNKSKKKAQQPEHIVNDTAKTAGSESPRKKKSVEGTEEDVDIDVDDDMPTANFPPVVIDKDAGNEVSKTSGETSSSSSGSSSSESDSGSSSGSDSDAEGPRNAGIEKPTSQKEPMGLGAVSEQMDSQNEPLSPAEHPDVVENGDSSQGAGIRAENSAADKQPERQVSPEKNLRAALLKGRFADTILKAREKTFHNKSDNVDPEKLRKEREELERKQKEERQRLMVEAHAAKVARKKAEAEAATENKKKMEAEREAARKRLQQMERTVELDAQCEVLKDFDLLRTTSMEQFQSSAGEVSPANSPHEGGFALQGGGNPLEQLGLFMKLDEEEDDKQGDGEVAYAEGTDENGEVEEGEID